jgi:hypothetical protein
MVFAQSVVLRLAEKVVWEPNTVAVSRLHVCCETRRRSRFCAMQTLRTPDERFSGLPEFPYAPNYYDVDDGDGGSLRIAVVAEVRTRRVRAPDERRCARGLRRAFS